MESRVLQKKLKICGLLQELNNEIFTSIDFLLNLKGHSTEIVRNLNLIKKPSLYFDEFVKVHSVILKYLSFINEVNCKFEILQIPDKRQINFSLEEWNNFHLENWNYRVTSNLIPAVEEAPNKELNLSVSLTENERKGLGNKQISIFGALSVTDKLPEMKIRKIFDIQNKDDDDEIKFMKDPANVGDEFEVIVENIKSPSEFYVYIKNAELGLFADMKEKLERIQVRNAEWDNTVSKKAWIMNELGSFVLFYSKCEEMWFRSKIINWFSNYRDDYVEIFLVDYGEYKCVSVYDLHIMPEHIKRYPIFITRCHLHGIQPFDATGNEDKYLWVRGVTEVMYDKLDESNLVKIKIGPGDKYHPASSLPVALWLADKNVCLNNVLVKKKYAVYSSNNVNGITGGGNENESETDSDEESTKFDNWNPMKEDFEAFENSYDLDVNDPASHIYGYVGQDYKKVCMLFAKTGHCYKGDACKLEHKKLDPLGYTTDAEEVFKSALNSFIVPLTKSVVEVKVTCVLNGDSFCCILAEQTLCNGTDNLHSLLRNINKWKNIQTLKRLSIPPSVGQIVLAKYNEDAFWYRAKIIEAQPERDNFTVLFVDYGNKQDTSLSEMRVMEAKYLHLPFQLLTCYIHGIEVNPDVPKEKVVEYLGGKIIDKKIEIEVVSQIPGDDPVLMVNLFDASGNNIAEDLLNNNFAVAKKELVVGNDSAVIPG